VIPANVAQLRNLVRERLAPTIEIHRLARREKEPDYMPPSDDPTDEEVDDFLVSNPRFHSKIYDLVEHFVDEGLLGYQFKAVDLTPKQLESFLDAVTIWAAHPRWLAAELPWLRDKGISTQPEYSLVWRPGGREATPAWVVSAPASLLLAGDLLKSGRLLSEMHWRAFEELIGALLEIDGWSVNVTRAVKDGGIEIIAVRSDQVLGTVRSLWQAKKYGPSKKVRLHEVRELAAVRDSEKATKALVVTTSRLTRDALEWIKRDVYRLGYQQQGDIEAWVRRALSF
jgi:hypothetical protein